MPDWTRPEPRDGAGDRRIMDLQERLRLRSVPCPNGGNVRVLHGCHTRKEMASLMAARRLGSLVRAGSRGRT
jgi:hypothetical protein